MYNEIQLKLKEIQIQILVQTIYIGKYKTRDIAANSESSYHYHDTNIMTILITINNI